MPFALGVLSLGGLFAGCDAGLTLEPVKTRVAFVGTQLSIPLNVTGAAGPVRFGFRSDSSTLCREGRCRGGIRNGEPASMGTAEAAFEWIPESSDIGSVNFEFTVTDGVSTETISTRVEVRSSVGYEGLPQFIQPLGNGATLDLSQNDCFEFDIVVNDPDSLEVDIRQLPPVIEGSELSAHDGFSAGFQWCPRAEQIRLGDHRRIVIAADDGEATSTKEYLLVLRRPAKSDCGGEPPELLHEPVHHSGLGDVPVRVSVRSAAGIKHAPLLYYSSSPIPDRPNYDELTQLSMNLMSGDRNDGEWEARIPNPTRHLPEGASSSVYYFVSATNSDDSAGPCDQHAAAPPRGAFEVDIRAPGDTAGPDDSLVLCEACATDRQCGERNDLCVTMGTRGSSFCLASCGSDRDCDSGYECSGRLLSSIDGARGRQCVPTAGVCEPETTSGGSCTDDFEDNDTLGLASSGRPLSPGSYDAVSCNRDETGDDDWYRIELDADGQVEISIEGSRDTDIDLSLLNEDGELIQVSESTRSDESITRCLEEGVYFVRVFAFGTGANAYTLDWSTRAMACDARCRADSEESDDDARRARAVNLGAGYTSRDNTICSGNDDWYEIQLTAGQTMAVDLTFLMTGPEGDLDIHFYDQELVDQTPCSEADPSTCSAFQGQSLDSNEYYDYTAATAGTYYLVVHGFDGAENSYDIRIWEEFF